MHSNNESGTARRFNFSAGGSGTSSAMGGQTNNRMPPPARPPVPQPVWSNNNNNNTNNRDIVVIDDNDDDDLLDISDNELIRASQQVESSLRFTNNVHHTTSNALNIFSQFTVDAPASQLPPSTLYSNSNLIDHDEVSKLKSEYNQLKNDKMQREGEVKILRDKLKRLEQENQKVRTEKADLTKKLQQKSDDSSKEFQKIVEFKDLQNHMKDQEIMELTMRYRVLEAAVRKNPNSVMLVNQQASSIHSPPSHPPIAGNLTPPSQSYHKTTSMPMKRTAPPASITDENEQPETKRPTLSIPQQRMSGQQILQNKNNNIIPSHSFKATRSSDQLTTTSILTTTTSILTKPPIEPVRPPVDLKRKSELKTKLASHYSQKQSSPPVYIVTDHLTDMSNFLTSRFTRPLVDVNKYEPLSHRMSQFVKFMSNRRRPPCDVTSQSPTTWSSKIESVVCNLNTELTRLLLSHFLRTENNLFGTLIQTIKLEQSGNNIRQFKMITDLACSVYSSLFELFLFHIENSTNRDPVYLQSICKEMFTSVMANWLQFIDYARLTTTSSQNRQDVTKRVTNLDGDTNENALSTWCLSYLTLNMLGVFIDSVNVLSSRMTLFQIARCPVEPQSNIYLSILDSMHSIQSQTYLLFHIKDGGEMSESDVCLYHMMCQKLQKYFNELAYSFDSLSNSSSSYTATDSDQQASTDGSHSSVEIITTIGNDLPADSKIDFKLAKHHQKSSTSSLLDDQDSATSSTTLPHSKSQNDLHFEFLQSQAPAQSPNVKPVKSSEPEIVHSTPTTSFKHSAIDVCYIEQIRTLQLNLVSKFFHFMTENRVTECVENRLLSRSVTNKSLITNRIRCKCHIDLLQTILPVIDYQYNEKLINDPDTELGFSDYINSRSSHSNSSYLLNWPVRTSQSSKQKESSTLSKGVKYFYMQMINCFSVAWSYLNPTPVHGAASTRDELAEQRVKLNDSLLKYDYRMRHYLSLYKLADLSYQEASEEEQPQRTKSSLVSITNLFRSFVDEYFDYRV